MCHSILTKNPIQHKKSVINFQIATSSQSRNPSKLISQPDLSSVQETSPHPLRHLDTQLHSSARSGPTSPLSQKKVGRKKRNTFVERQESRTKERKQIRGEKLSISRGRTAFIVIAGRIAFASIDRVRGSCATREFHSCFKEPSRVQGVRVRLRI